MAQKHHVCAILIKRICKLKHHLRHPYEKYASQNAKYTNQNTKYANQNTKYINQNIKYANQNTEYSNQNTKYANQNNKCAIPIIYYRCEFLLKITNCRKFAHFFGVQFSNASKCIGVQIRTNMRYALIGVVATKKFKKSTM